MAITNIALDDNVKAVRRCARRQQSHMEISFTLIGEIVVKKFKLF
jgi:hypothetical protein